MSFDLLGQSKTTLEEVVNNLAEQKLGTPWAEKTNQFAIDYTLKLGQVYGDTWYKGLLPKELFLQILLPKHGHEYDLGKVGEYVVLIPEDTSVSEVPEILKANKNYPENCIELINYLKEGIKKDGFKSSLVLVVINGQLKHVDGLHRMIALALLLEEGYEYNSIPTFLCDSTK